MTLDAIRTDSGFSLISLADPLAVADHTGLSLQNPDQAAEVAAIISEASTVLASHASGVCLAPDVGFSAVAGLPKNAGVVFELSDMTRAKDPLTVPVLAQTWGVQQTRNNYGIAKLELYYNPQEEDARSKKQMVVELADYCRHEGIAFIVDLVLYLETAKEKYAAQFLELQLDAVAELQEYCDLFFLEYPIDPLSAVTLTAGLDVPWIVSGRGVPYEEFKEQVRASFESGAQGYVIGSQLLPAEVPHEQRSPERVAEFFATTARDRVIELERITKEIML
jgi:tagatose-1,6-bisphosphate aldolase